MKKKKVVQRLLEEASLKNRQDYFKQYAILKSLLKKYDNEDFWAVVNFDEKLKSLYYLKTPYGKKVLEKKYKEFNYKPKGKDIKYRLAEKSGEDKVSHKNRKTIREFLNE